MKWQIVSLRLSLRMFSSPPAKSILLFILLFISSFAAQASSIDPAILDFVQNSPVLQVGGVSTVDIDGASYLVATGVRASMDNSPKSLISAMRLARIRAEEAFMRFSRGETVTVSEKLDIHHKITTVDGKTSSERQEKLTIIQRAMTQGYLAPIETIDGVPNLDGNVMHVIYFKYQ